jgi:cell cycle checkpoint control protein RAD9A
MVTFNSAYSVSQSTNAFYIPGVVKTHRLLLNTVTEHYVPRLFDATLENKVVVRPKAIKEIVDHFPMAKGGGFKGDPQLIWRFDEGEVKVKSLEEAVGARGGCERARRNERYG